MKEKLCTLIAAVFVFLPWTIFPLRTFDWALELPAARIIIIAYALFMILSGVVLSLSTSAGRSKIRL